MPILAPTNSILPLLVELAALFHDLGKANQRFQEKLAAYCKSPSKKSLSAKKPQPLMGEKWRHELLSVLLIHRALERGATLSGRSARQLNDTEGFSALADPQSWGWLQKDVDFENLSPDSSSLGHAAHPAFSFMTASADKGHPFLSTLLWLVASHHRLPDDYQKAGAAGAKYFTNLTNLWIEETTERSCAPGLAPWDVSSWMSEVSRVSQAIASALKSSGSLGASDEEIALISALWLRPLLVYADHTASRTITDAPLAQWPQPAAIFANLTDENATGDLLHTHLLSVGRFSRHYFNLAAASAAAPFVRVEPDNLLCQPIFDNKFEWQQHAADALALPGSAGKPSARPTFVAVIAETGTGKTLGGARIAKSLCGGTLRATFAFGMRSLTLQTGKEFFGTGLSDSCVVLVGNPASRMLFEQEQQKKESQGAESGDIPFEFEVEINLESIASDAAQPDFLSWLPDFFDEAAMHDNLPPTTPSASHYLRHTPKGEKLNALLSAPILVCTIDHLIRCVEGARGGQLASSLRAMTSDLILDELDAYSPDDLVSISKLATLHGIAGRHVIVMSATASPVAVQGIFDAWKHGVALRARFFDANLAPRSAVVANCAPFVEISTAPTSEAFSATWSVMVGRTLSALKMAPKKRHFNVFDLPLPASAQQSPSAEKDKLDPFSPIWETVANQAQNLHKENHVNVPHKGGQTRVSIGFVRFSTARNAARFTRWALCADHADLRNVRVLCYHSKYPMLHLAHLEGELNRMLRRKDEERTQGASLGADPLVARHLLNADGSSPADIVFIVSTTTLNETGRDHDYDWCILEPRSVRGEVQAVGRVRRHRFAAWDKINVAFMDRPLGLFRENPTSAWGFPGIETRQKPGSGTPTFAVNRSLRQNLSPLFKECFSQDFSFGQTGQKENLRLAKEALPFASWLPTGLGLNAAPCLTRPASYEENPIGCLEMAEQFAFLSSSGNRLDGLPPSSHIFRTYAREHAWFGHHARVTSFRRPRHEADTLDVFCLPDVNSTTAMVHFFTHSSPGRATQKSIPFELRNEAFDLKIVAERIFFRSDNFWVSGWANDTQNVLSHFLNQSETLLAQQRIPGAEARRLLLSVDFPPRSARQKGKTPNDWGWSFHPLLGLWRNF